MVKVRNPNELKTTEEQFLNQMSDKPFGIEERVERITISLEGSLFDKIDEMVRIRKRLKQENRTMSAYIREAILFYMEQNKKT